jgi:hypothetical protein
VAKNRMGEEQAGMKHRYILAAIIITLGLSVYFFASFYNEAKQKRSRTSTTSSGFRQDMPHGGLKTFLPAGRVS